MTKLEATGRMEKGEAQEIVLSYLLEHPGEQFTVMQIVDATGLSTGTVRQIVRTSSRFPVTDNGHGLFSLDPTFDPDKSEKIDPSENGIPYWSGEELWVKGSVPRALGGDGMVMPYPSADEQFDLEHMALEEKFERLHDRWKELHGRRDLGELGE